MPRMYALNEQVFDTITEESAYWIGFIMGDGCVHGNYLSVCLSIKDENHLFKLQKFLGSLKPLYYINNTGFYKAFKTVTFKTGSKKLVNSLFKYGIVSNKSHTSQVIGLENNKHYWRGMIDANGTLGIDNSLMKRSYLELSASQNTCEQFKSFVSNNHPLCRANVTSDKNHYRYKLCGRYATELAYLLYKDCSIYLDRKYNSALNIINNQTRKINPSCKFCQSIKIVKDGKTSQGNQSYWCKECNKTFT